MINDQVLTLWGKNIRDRVKRNMCIYDSYVDHIIGFIRESSNERQPYEDLIWRNCL